MSNTTTTTKTAICDRCRNGGLAHIFKHVEGGRCFECGRIRGAVVPVVVVAETAAARAQREANIRARWPRERIIAQLAVVVRNAERAAAEGDFEGFMAFAMDGEGALPGLLAIAPADVRARAEAAFARIRAAA